MKNAFSKSFLILVAAVGLLFESCSTERFTAKNLPARQIRFGTGGGFTGRESLFLLLENGQIFEQKLLTGGFVEKPAAKKRAAKKLFQRHEKLPIEVAAFDRPANFYYFLESQIDSAKSVRAVWGDDNFPPPEAVKTLFFDLNKLVFTKPSGEKN